MGSTRCFETFTHVAHPARAVSPIKALRKKAADSGKLKT